MKIPLQEKIAELEARIVALEKAQKCSVRSEVRHVDLSSDKDWKGIWFHFDKLFKRLFR